MVEDSDRGFTEDEPVARCDGVGELVFYQAC
jgi:hypothetical protein